MVSAIARPRGSPGDRVQFFLVVSVAVVSAMVESFIIIVESFIVESGLAAAAVESGVLFAESTVAAFGVCALTIVNPEVSSLASEQLRSIEQAMGSPLKVIWQHL